MRIFGTKKGYYHWGLGVGNYWLTAVGVDPSFGQWLGGASGTRWVFTIGSGSTARNVTSGLDEAPAARITTAVPEPETYAMMMTGLGLLGFMTRRRKARQQ